MAWRRPRRMTGGDDVSVSLSSDVQLYIPYELFRRYICSRRQDVSHASTNEIGSGLYVMFTNIIGKYNIR